MTKKYTTVIVCLVFLTLLLSGCKMPASQSPTKETGEAKTTPIRIQTDSPQFMTQTAAAKAAETAETAVEPTPTNTPEPTEVIQVPTVTTPAEYTLKEGEFLYCIARRFNLNPQDLLAVNNIAEGEIVSPGTTLQIPQTGAWPGDSRTLKPHPTTHTVAAGETIYSIACEYGDVTPEAIIAFNQLAEPYDLSAGQPLQIP